MNWLYFESEKPKVLSPWGPDAWGEKVLVDDQMKRSSMESQVCNECLVQSSLHYGTKIMLEKAQIKIFWLLFGTGFIIARRIFSGTHEVEQPQSTSIYFKAKVLPLLKTHSSVISIKTDYKSTSTSSGNSWSQASGNTPLSILSLKQQHVHFCTHSHSSVFIVIQ